MSEDVKQARELALMGNYEQANTYYYGTIQSVQQILKQIHEPDQKQKWREVNAGIYFFIFSNLCAMKVI